MALLFISSVVPDTQRYHNAAFTRSGNNVLLGILKSFDKSFNPTFLSLRPIPSFPKAPLWIPCEKVILKTGEKIILLPTLNIKLIKNVFWNILTFIYVLCWTFKYRHQSRDILVYNIYLPSISTLYKAAKLTKSKLFAILYDLGVPPKRLGLSKLTMFAYKIGERIAKKYIPKLDGRIVINENIIDYYAPGADCILVDGGINDDVIANLPPLKESQNKTFTFVLAGMLWDQNGTKLIIDTLKGNPNLGITVIFAGKGIDVPYIEEYAKIDPRAKYVGMLNMTELFKLYSEVNCLLNLRLEEEIDFHFPSKLLEYMVTGTHVLSTPVAHAEREYGDYITILHDISPKGLADAIMSIMSDDKKTIYRKGELSRDYMLKHRNWNSQTKRIEDYIKSKH